MAKVTIKAGETVSITSESADGGGPLFTSANTQVSANKVDSPLTFTAKVAGSTTAEPLLDASGSAIPPLSTSNPSFVILNRKLSSLEVTGGGSDSVIEIISL